MIDIEALFGPLAITASLVVDHDGRTNGPDGTSKSLGGEVDLELLKAFRRNAGAVLTTGRTARVENYKPPSSAELFVLSRKQRHTLPSAIRGTTVKILGPSSIATPEAAVDYISALGHAKLHVECGPQTLLELMSSRVPMRLFVSSESEHGARKFSEANKLAFGQSEIIEYLHVTEVAGRA